MGGQGAKEEKREWKGKERKRKRKRIPKNEFIGWNAEFGEVGEALSDEVRRWVGACNARTEDLAPHVVVHHDQEVCDIRESCVVWIVWMSERGEGEEKRRRGEERKRKERGESLVAKNQCWSSSVMDELKSRDWMLFQRRQVERRRKRRGSRKEGGAELIP